MSETENVLRGFGAGGTDYVLKPIVIDELLARVRAHLANGRIAQTSHMALDTSGRPSFGVDGNGRVLWFTPMAAEIIERLFPDWRIDDGLPPALEAPVRQLRSTDPQPGVRIVIDLADSKLECAFLGRAGAGEWLFRLNEQRERDQQRLLADRLGVTAREAEVLLWVSRGKKNREVSEILEISPRTVNKHLEQIFAKLGVENRASAAAIAVGMLTG